MDSSNRERIEARERERHRLREERTGWFLDAGYGLMTHGFVDWCYVDEEPGMDTSVTIEDFDALVNEFDVDEFAAQVDRTGAGYVIFALGQSSGYYCAPNPVYDEYLTEAGVSQRYTAGRDLPMELADALDDYGIRLLFYVSNGGCRNPEVAEAMEWSQRWGEGKIDSFSEQTKVNWESVLEWWGDHYGTKLDGWWHDSFHWPEEWDESKQHNFSTLAASLRQGNTDRILAYNLGAGAFHKLSNSEDYVAGEEPQLDRIPESRWHQGLQWHVLSYLGDNWTTRNCRFSNEKWIDYIRRCTENGGVVSIGFQNDHDGSIPDPQLDQLTAIRTAVEE